MGTPITGRETLIGLKKASAWRTPVACGANDGILILSETLKQTREHLQDDSAGLAFVQRTDPGKINAAGDITSYLRYEGLDVALALAMGQAGAPTQQGVTAAYANAYKLTTNPAGLFATLALLKKSDIVHEFPSAKLHGFRISGEMNAPLQITFSALANLLELASATNTAATMANVTYPDKGNRVIFNSSATFKINDESGIALADGNKVYPSSFEFAFNRPMEGDLTAGNEDIDEPVGTGFPEITLTLNFPRYNDANHQFFTDWDAYTRKKMEIYFKGVLIADTYYYEFKMSFPNLKIADPDAAISGPGKIPASIPFTCLGTDTAPAGMTGITQPFQINVQNKRTTDPLA